MKASFRKHILHFKTPGGTSRGILKTKETWYIIIEDGEKKGIGECAIFRDLSVDDRPDYADKLAWTCNHIDQGEQVLLEELTAFPSIQIGLETAFRSLKGGNPFHIFPSDFSEGQVGIPINGLIWMGDTSSMQQQIALKLKEGFNCLKMKIGAIDFQAELALLTSIRKRFSAAEIELRVDANGAFAASEALEKLKILSELQLHSIEQPIKAGQWQEMARLCETSPLPIALDEELIGVFSEANKKELLETVSPQYIILKPSLIGGFRGSDQWIKCADESGIGYWMTSALESNIGLNAISQYSFTKSGKLPQGLGTGKLFSNNIKSPLKINKGTIWYDKATQWDLTQVIHDW